MITNKYVSETELEFYNTLYDFAKERILISAEQRDRDSVWSEELWEEAGAMGLNGIAVPEEYGGQGASCLQVCLAAEAMNIGCGDGGFGLAWGAHAVIGTMPIVLFGNEEQKRKYLPRIAGGEWIAGMALTEPGSGSDAAALRTTAREEGDHFILNGTKMFITNGPVGQVFVVYARTKAGASRGPMGISAFIVDKDMPGFSVGKVLHKLGMHTSTTSELIFEDLKVPRENLLGPLNSGFMRIGKAVLEWERTVLVAGSVGFLGFALEQTLGYAQEREQFSRPIIDFYGVQEKLARNWVLLQASRRYSYYVAGAKDRGAVLPLQSSILKLLVTEAAEDVARDGVQLLGGYGFMQEYHLERFFRDSKLATIGGGTSEVMRNIVASTFPGFASYLADIQDFYPESVRENAERNHSQDMFGEMNLLLGLEELLKAVSPFVKKSSHQFLAFAFADLIVVYSALKQSAWDRGLELEGYTVEERAREQAILSHTLMRKYAGSIQALMAVNPEETRKVFQAFLELKDLEKQMEACVESLKRGPAVPV